MRRRRELGYRAIADTTAPPAETGGVRDATKYLVTVRR